MANDSSLPLRKELTKINNKLHNGSFKSPYSEFDDLKFTNIFPSSLPLPSHIQSPSTSSSPTPHPSQSPSPSSNLSPLSNNVIATPSSSSLLPTPNYSFVVPKLDFFDPEKIGEKRKFDQFSSHSLSADSSLPFDDSSLPCDDSFLDSLFIQSHESIRCNQFGDNDLYFEGKKRKTSSFLASEYIQRDKSKLNDLLTFDRTLYQIPPSAEEEERGEINIQIKKKSDIAQQNKSKITLIYSSPHRNEDESTLFFDPSVPTLCPISPLVSLNQKNLPPLIFPCNSENLIDYTKKIDERTLFLEKEVIKLRRNSISLKDENGPQIISVNCDFSYNNQSFSIQLLIPLEYPNLSPNYTLFSGIPSEELPKGYQMITDKFQKQLVSIANPTVTDIVTSFVSAIESF